jgi:hypothetical protein
MARFASRCEPSLLLSLFAIAAVCTGIAVLVFQLMVVSEAGQAEQSFQSVFARAVPDFVGFMRTRLLGIRSVADSLNVNSNRADPEVPGLVRTAVVKMPPFFTDARMAGCTCQ